MRRDNCTFAEYEAWFEGECNNLIIEPGFSVVGPILEPLGEPDSAPWNSNFAILYPDGMHVRVAEYFRILAKKEGGGGCLRDFAYHYGPTSNKVDRDGFPRQIKACELRIDLDLRHNRHIHYLGEDHIPESRLPGLDFENMDPFVFIRAIEAHRKNPHQPLPTILGFTVEPAK